jgi:hypothetical protein
MRGRRQTLLYDRSYLMNFRLWNYYNCAFYYYYLIMDKIYKINKSNIFITFVRMGDLPVLLPNATPLVSRCFAEMSKKPNLENNFSI